MNLVRGLAALRLVLRDNPPDGGENLLHRRFVLRFRLAAHASPATRGPEGPGSTADRAVARPVLYHWIAGKRKFSVNQAARGNRPQFCTGIGWYARSSDRKRVVWGKSVSLRVDFGGRR